MLAFVGLLLVVYWIGTEFGESAGVIAISALVVLIVCMLFSADRKQARAHRNWVNYWAKGGPERRR